VIGLSRTKNVGSVLPVSRKGRCEGGARGEARVRSCLSPLDKRVSRGESELTRRSMQMSQPWYMIDKRPLMCANQF